MTHSEGEQVQSEKKKRPSWATLLMVRGQSMAHTAK